MLGTHTATNDPVVAAWNSALLAPAVSLAVASTTIHLNATFSFAPPSTAVTNAVASAICLTCAFREAARFCATMSLAKSTGLS